MMKKTWNYDIDSTIEVKFKHSARCLHEKESELLSPDRERLNLSIAVEKRFSDRSNSQPAGHLCGTRQSCLTRSGPGPGGTVFSCAHAGLLRRPAERDCLCYSFVHTAHEDFILPSCHFIFNHINLSIFVIIFCLIKLSLYNVYGHGCIHVFCSMVVSIVFSSKIDLKYYFCVRVFCEHC